MGKTIYRSYKMGGMWDLSILKKKRYAKLNPFLLRSAHRKQAHNIAHLGTPINRLR